MELSIQQKRIVEKVLKGKSNKQIAFELGVCEGMIKSHLSSIYRRLGYKQLSQGEGRFNLIYQFLAFDGSEEYTLP